MAKKTINLGTTPDGEGGDDIREAFTKTNENFVELYRDKVSAEAGKQLSDENYTLDEKNKLAGIAVKATKNRADSENADKDHAHEIEQVNGLSAALLEKLDKTDVVQSSGQSTEKVMSQKVVTEMFNNLIPWMGSTIPSSGTVFDFEKNRYAEKGVPVGLSDISEFIRLSSATIWQNGKLVEVVNSIPRISGEGLLIEKSATELIRNNSTITSTNTAWTATQKTDTQIGNVFEFVSDGSDAVIRTDIPVYPNSNVSASSGYYYKSVIVKKTDSVGYITLGTSGALIVVNTSTGVVEYTQTNVTTQSVSIINGFILIRIISPGGIAIYNQFYVAASNVRGTLGNIGAPTAGHKVTIAFPSFRDTADFPQSIIKTTGVQSTRSKETLVVPFEIGQTVTADKDEGVTMTIADNNAVFEGHGYIRSIRVN